MFDYTDAEKLKKAREIADLEYDKRKLQHLLNNRNEKEMEKLLRELSSKYFSEKLCWNAGHPELGRDAFENAQNCITFLNSLVTAKMVDEFK